MVDFVASGIVGRGNDVDLVFSYKQAPMPDAAQIQNPSSNGFQFLAAQQRTAIAPPIANGIRKHAATLRNDVRPQPIEPSMTDVRCPQL
jgi:hypothetical protein